MTSIKTRNPAGTFEWLAGFILYPNPSILALYMVRAHCDDCGGESVYHGVEYAAVLLDTLLMPMFTVPAIWWRRIAGAKKTSERPVLIKLYKGFTYLGLAELLDKPDGKTLLLDHVLWEEAKRRGIAMREFRLLGTPNNTFMATLPGGRRIAFYGVPLAYTSEPAWWINDKSILKKRLGELDVPVPRGDSFATLRAAQDFFMSLGRPVITKPSIGSASRHTTMHINDASTLTKGFAVAKQVSPYVIVEEELAGCVYRPTVVRGRLLATLRRDQPFVVGDGTSTIEELVAEENKNPKRGGPYFSPITLNAAADVELALQSLSRTGVPSKGQRVQLHPKINWALGGTTTDVSDEVHSDNIELFERIAAILNVPLVGIDFIIKDISRSWHEQPGCGVIECNDMPYFDNHHLPFKGKPRDIAGPVWDLIEQKT